MEAPSVNAIDQAWELCVANQEQQALLSLEGNLPQEHRCTDLEAAKIAVILIRAGEVASAWVYLDRDWRAAEPFAAGLAGAMGLALGMPQWSEPLLRQACTAHQVDSSHWINLGRCLIHLDQAHAAADLLEQLDTSSMTPERADQWLLCLVEALIAAGQAEKALALLPANLDAPQACAIRARVLAYLGRHDQAFEELRLGLRDCPHQLELLVATADLAEALGRTQVSTAALQAAVKAEPERLEFWIRLVHSCCTSRLESEAEVALAEVKALVEGRSAAVRATALAAEAHVASMRGCLAEAESFYQNALIMNPLLLNALSGLGNLYLQLGRIEEAIKKFEVICTIAPLCGWTHMIQAHQTLQNPEVVELLELAAQRPSLEGPINSGLLFCLAAHYDKSREAQKAFAAALQANEASKAAIGYCPINHRRQVEAVIKQFTPAFFEQRSGWGSSSQVPLFIVGMPRSGTTLTEQILASHPKVFGAGELGQIPELIARMEQWERKLGSPLRYPLCVNELDRTSAQLYAEQLLESLRALAPDGSTYITDKLPHNFENIGLVRLLFPRCKIIHVRRDPLDVATSNFFTDYAAKQGGMGFAYDLRWIGEQLQDERRLRDHWQSVFPVDILDVNYEDLIAHPAREARRLLDYLDLEWDESIMAFQELNRPVKTASVWQVRQPIYSTSKGRWRRYEDQLQPLAAMLESPLPEMPGDGSLPLPPPGSFHAGMRCLRQGQPARAERHFSALLSHYPNHAAAEHFRGVALLDLGRPQEAVLMMERSVRKCPEHVPWRANLATAKAVANAVAAM